MFLIIVLFVICCDTFIDGLKLLLTYIDVKDDFETFFSNIEFPIFLVFIFYTFFI